MNPNKLLIFSARIFNYFSMLLQESDPSKYCICIDDDRIVLYNRKASYSAPVVELDDELPVENERLQLVDGCFYTGNNTGHNRMESMLDL